MMGDEEKNRMGCHCNFADRKILCSHVANNRAGVQQSQTTLLASNQIVWLHKGPAVGWLPVAF
jgi:hypothetical protein